MRAIDADAFKDYIRGACEEMKHLYKDNGAWAKEITESFCKDIDEQPTIQPEPKRGKWKSEDGCTGCKYEGKTGEHLPCDYCTNNFKNQWTAKDDKIEVGDEVTHKSDSITWTAVVTQNVDGILTLMGKTGAIAEDYDEKCFVKTGRHFDIASILEAMKHD